LTEKAGEISLERHASRILRQYRDLWLSYNEWLKYFKSFLDEIKLGGVLSVEDDELFSRFGFKAGLNSLFFIYEIGSISPTVTWRHIVKSGYGLSPILLNRPASFLPAFSFSMDRPVTLIYWGEQNPFLSVEMLREINLKNFILKVENPSSVKISTMNLVWPKSARITENQELKHWASLYLFNALLPPTFDASGELWSESPFIIVDDRDIILITLHKTLCSVDEKSARIIERRGIVNIRSTIIDRDLKHRNILIDIPQEYLEEFIERKYLCESIFVKRVWLRGYPESGSLKPYKRYTVYPFSSAELFKEESYGRLLTAMSIILRDSYLKSRNPLSLALTPRELKDKMRSFLHGVPGKELGLRLLESEEGLSRLVSLLEVYYPEDSSFLYLHPVLIECFYILAGRKGKLTRENLLHFLKAVSRYYSTSKPLTPAQFKEFYEKLASITGFAEGEAKLRILMDSIRDPCIPLSKFLYLPMKSG